MFSGLHKGYGQDIHHAAGFGKKDSHAEPAHPSAVPSAEVSPSPRAEEVKAEFRHDAQAPAVGTRPTEPVPAVAATPAHATTPPAASGKYDLSEASTGVQAPVISFERKLPQHLELFFTAVVDNFRKIADLHATSKLTDEEIRTQIHDFIEEYARIHDSNVSRGELQRVADAAYEEIVGLGVLEILLREDSITDIMVNGPSEIYVEIHGCISRTDLKFRDEQNLINVCQKIVSKVGRRVDESSPICDARLPDGSRVNVILPPLAVHGTSLTIRKFSRERLTLNKLLQFGTLSEQCAAFMKIMAMCRVNILVSGGTGSGKTTLLNCLTRYISADERIVTCEDTAELQLQQPHVVTLETRPPNTEGQGQITMRDLVKNCLRMRPDRIIVGEVRGPEAFDLLQAMNTGHDGSMGTLHANSPRDALSRLENMIAMANLNIPASRIREQIASAINIIVHVERLHGGPRRVTQICEVAGMEGEVVLLQDLFLYTHLGLDAGGKAIGTLSYTGYRPRLFEKARDFGLEDKLMEVLAPL